MAVLKAAKQLKRKDWADFMHDLTHVICAPNSEDGLKSVLHLWRTISEDAIPEFAKPRVKYDATTGTPKIPWKQATDVIVGELRTMKRLAGHE